MGQNIRECKIVQTIPPDYTVNSFQVTAYFLHPLKTKNQNFSEVVSHGGGVQQKGCS